MKKKYFILIILGCCIAIFGIVYINKKNDGSLVSLTSKEETDNDIKIENECENLTSGKANAIAKEIKEIMIETQKDINVLENFSVKFSNERPKEEKTVIDVTVEADWTTIRKPEDNPVIIGMNEVVESLKTEEEKKKAKVIISGFLAEMEGEYNKTERLPDYFRVTFKDKSDLNYEIFCMQSIKEDTILYPMREYYEKNYKENREERIKLGRETLLENMED